MYGKPSNNEYKESTMNNNTKYEKKRYQKHSVHDDNLCETDSDEKEEEEEIIDYEYKNNHRKNKYSSFEVSEGKKVSSIKHSNIYENYRVTPDSYSKDVDTFHTDKFKSSQHNKNLEFLFKDNMNSYQDEIPYNPRYPNNNQIYNLSYLYSSGISNNPIGNNNLGNNFNHYSIPNPYNYQSHNLNNQRQRMTQSNDRNNYIFPKNSSGRNNSSRQVNGGLFKDPLSCSYCEEFYKMALFQSVPLQLLSCPYCSNTLNQSSLQFYYKKYENELNESIKKNLEYPNEASKQNTITRSTKQPNNNYPLNGNSECQNMSTYPTRNNVSSIHDENRREEYTNRETKEVADYESERYTIDENSKHKNFHEKLDKSSSSNNIKKQKLKRKIKEEVEDTENQEKFENQREIKNDKKNKELILIKIDDADEDETDNLAEMFKKKKLALMEKLEKRKQEKENKPEKEEKKEEIREIKIIKKKKFTKKESKKELVQSIKSAAIKEPSQELLHRLSLGEKANVLCIVILVNEKRNEGIKPTSN